MVENVFGIFFRVLLGTMEPFSRVLRDIVFMCVVLHNMMKTHPADRAPAPVSDLAALHN